MLNETGTSIQRKKPHCHWLFNAGWLANSLAYRHCITYGRIFRTFFFNSKSRYYVLVICPKIGLISVIILSWGHWVENWKQLGLFCKLFCWICLMSILFILSFRSWRGFTKWPWGAFDFPNHLLSFKREDVPVGTFGCFSQSCKLEPDTHELGSTMFWQWRYSPAFVFCIIKYFG